MADRLSDDPWAAWRGRLQASRDARNSRVTDWQTNVRKRTGDERNREDTTSLLSTQTARASVNKDWPLTKAKIALLYSQTPELRLVSQSPEAAQIVPPFAKTLNETIRTARVGAAIEEELADVVNAAGISGVVIACEKRTAEKQVPKYDPMIAQLIGSTETIPITAVTDIRYPVHRLSPASLLVPREFAGSVYDEARWLGYDESMPWATAQLEFGLTDEDKERVTGADRKASTQNTLTTDTSRFQEAESVNFTELFYWRHHYHADETSYSALQRMVFVEGKDEPVINEPYKGQQRLPDGRIVGVTRNPIQILTLTYISDENLPPSDSTISRWQTTELEQSRTQMALQRKHSIPFRWGDTNRISANQRTKIDAGDFQGFIWTNGPGDRAVGEVPRAAFPPEKYELDSVIDREITDQWQVGPNQMSGFASGERSAREAGIVERNFQTRIGQERAKVERHFLAIAEVLGGLLSLHGGAAMPVELLGSLAYSIRVDSTVLLDAEQQIERLTRGLNLTAQSGYVNAKPIIEEIWELLGVNPAEHRGQPVVINPQPKAPEPIKVSIGSAEDAVNPIMLALAYQTNQGPSPEALAAAIKAIQTAALGPVPIVPMEPVDPNAPPRDIETPGLANAGWETAPRIERRAEDGGA